MTHLERFLDSDLWKSQEPFTIAQMCYQLVISKTLANEILRGLEGEVRRIPEPGTTRSIYQRVNPARDFLHIKMASNPEVVYGSREWV